MNFEDSIKDFNPNIPENKENQFLENLDPKDPKLLEYLGEIKNAFKEIPWIATHDLTKANALLIAIKEELAGGILAFSEAPESDVILNSKEKLLGPGGLFLSCLYIKEKFRGRNLWRDLLEEEIDRADKLGTYIWGVVSNKGLLDLYKRIFNLEIFDLNNGLYLVKINKNKE